MTSLESAAPQRVARKHHKQKKPISPTEVARWRRQSAHDRAQRETDGHPDRVLTFRQWCAVNAFSEATGCRILKSGNGPPVLDLSDRRIGIRESDNRAWQLSRQRA